MLFKRIDDEDLAQASYIIGCQASGEAVVVDPRRDIRVYLEEAAKNKLRIVAVLDTHIHADYLSGALELAMATGSDLYLSNEGDEDWKYGFESVKLYDGSTIEIGKIILKAVHTPGHTPEHLSFLVTDGATASEPGFFLTGDFVFVGDIGRPDLLDEAAGAVDTRFEGARRLFESLRDKFLTLPDYVQVWPGHGSGSACGKALGAVASTTVGYERRFAWWVPFVEKGDLEGFTSALLEGQPDAPLYFGRMKRQNKAGPALLGQRPALAKIQASKLMGKVGSELILIDTRAKADYDAGAVPGALHVPGGKSFATYASYILDPEKDARPAVLLAGDSKEAHALRDKLAYVGIDNVIGYLTSLDGLERQEAPAVAPEGLGSLHDPFILDVRTNTEYQEANIPGATQLHAGRVMWNLKALPTNRPIVVHCQQGGRASVVASALRDAGFKDVLELKGSFDGWQEHQATEVQQ